MSEATQVAKVKLDPDQLRQELKKIGNLAELDNHMRKTGETFMDDVTYQVYCDEYKRRGDYLPPEY